MFRFTIRDVLWLTVVVALGVAWYIQHRQSMTDQQRALAELRQKAASELEDIRRELDHARQSERSAWMAPWAGYESLV